MLRVLSEGAKTTKKPRHRATCGLFGGCTPKQNPKHLKCKISVILHFLCVLEEVLLLLEEVLFIFAGGTGRRFAYVSQFSSFLVVLAKTTKKPKAAGGEGGWLRGSRFTSLPSGGLLLRSKLWRPGDFLKKPPKTARERVVGIGDGGLPFPTPLFLRLARRR